MFKKITSLIIIVILSGTVLTGCSFIPPLIKRVVQERLSDNDYKNDDKGDKMSDGGEQGKGNDEQGPALSPEIEMILTKDVNPVNELLLKIAKMEYQPSTFSQDDVASDTIKWICATYAIHNDINNKDMDIIGGYWELEADVRDEKNLEKTKQYLSDYCGVDSRETLVEVICVLLNFGNNTRYNIEVQEMIANGDIKADLVEKYGRGPEVFRKLAVQMAYERFGENGLAGWDLSRANQILGDAYYVEYINLEESLDLSFLISQRIQNTFNSWEEFCESDLYGSQFFRQDAPDDPTTETANRWETFDYLKRRAADGEGPLELPFDTKLKKSWGADAFTADGKAKEVPFEKKVPTEGEDGRITLYLGNERGAQIKVRIPEGFEMAEQVSNPLSIYVSKQDQDVWIIYRVDKRDDIEELKEMFEIEKNSDMDIYPDKTKLLTEKFEESEDEVTYYFATEVKDRYGEGNSTVGYSGFKAKKIDGKWIGLYAVMEARSDLGVTEEEAVSWLFSDIKFQ